MLQEILVQFKENFHQKVKTPFFGTFIIVWSVRHWELLYSLFNFDQDNIRVEKIGIIKNLLGDHSFGFELWSCLWMTFVSLVSSYTLINISRFITILFEKHITPLIYKFGDRSKVVTRDDFNREQRKNELLTSKLDKEKQQREDLQRKIEELEDRINEVNSKKNSESETNVQMQLEGEVKSLKESLEMLNKISKADKKEDRYKDIPDDFKWLFLKLSSENKLESYLASSKFIKEYGFINYSNPIIGDLITTGLVKPMEDNVGRRFIFTEKGYVFDKFFKDEIDYTRIERGVDRIASPLKIEEIYANLMENRK